MATIRRLPRAAGDLTLAQAVDAYLATLRGAEQASTRRTYGRILRWVLAEFGAGTALDEIDAKRFAEWFGSQWADREPSTWNVSLDAVRSAAAYWRRQGWLVADFSRMLVRRKPRPDRDRALSHSEVDQLLTREDKAIAEEVNAFIKLDVVRAWGEGKSVATDGTQVDTYIDNLLAESHIRYGGFGGIAYHYVSDTYVAIFSRFVPCGAWEAIYIIDGLLANASELKPKTVHADTQGQSFPVFTLAHLFGFDLMPRIRNWKGLTYFQHSDKVRYQHIDALFTDSSGGRHVIDWALVEKMWPDLMRVAISIKEGRLNSVTLLRRLGSHSRKNEIYKAFREVGRSVRTVALLRYLADPALHSRVTAVTNQVEAYNGFSGWLRFGNEGVLAANDPAEQEKMIKFNTLLADCVMFHTALDMTDILRDLVEQGWEPGPGKQITAADIAQLSPYINEHIARFGVYDTDVLKLKPKAFDPQLDGVDFDTLPGAA